MARLLQNIIENHEDFADSFSVRFLKLRISKELEDENEAFALAKECINEPSHLWMAKNLLLNCKSYLIGVSVLLSFCQIEQKIRPTNKKKENTLVHCAIAVQYFP